MTSPGLGRPPGSGTTLNGFRTLSEGSLVQYSVFMTRDMRGALAAVDLVKHYKGDVMLFRGQQVPA